MVYNVLVFLGSSGCVMGSGERVELLKDRARFFLSLARELLERGRYDIAAFCAEQAMQLRVKASLLRLSGEMPRIHGLRELLGILARVLEELGCRSLAGEVRRYTREYRDQLIDAEDAYTSARYGVFTLGAREVADVILAAKRLFELLEEVERRALG
ncbi:HEPN domain protein [Pyrolobus fumarii 1A]|uniref:HEPN domain protein n=2 Tax=Pyrolobus fumarii TaxID=54252 RepID=G0EG86_PYRF1|nr:HEPN domain protein [Pyrolobus fumarii 1A]